VTAVSGGGRPAGTEIPAGVGFIGLGQMGYPMAKFLRDWPGGLTVCDINTEVTDRFAKKGARVAATPREVAETSGVISVMVRDDAQVTEVVTGENGLLTTAKPGTIIAITSAHRSRSQVIMTVRRGNRSARPPSVTPPMNSGTTLATNVTAASSAEAVRA